MTQPSLPDYWMPRPGPALTPAEQASCDETFDAMLAVGADQPFHYTSPIPKWQFLCHLTARRGIALHGSNNPGITELTPRHASDLHEFGAQNAVYAAGDGIWPMYFAIVDRSRVNTLINACIWVTYPAGHVVGPLYLFSISRHAHPLHPYITGTIYLLPAETFKPEPVMPFGEFHVRSAQLASPAAVKPLAKLTVKPEDFPFLAHMRAHDDDRLAEYSQAIISRAPWPY
jgi:hypothetical protein